MYGPKRDQMLIQLREELEEFRGPELPNFINYQFLVNKVKFYLRGYHETVLHTIKTANDITKDVYSKMICSHYGQYPDLQRAVKV